MKDVFKYHGVEEKYATIICSLMVQQLFEPNDMLVRCGDEGDTIYFIEEGQAQVSVVIDGLDHRKRLRTLGPGAAFGEIALVDNKPRSADIMALTPVVCQLLSRSQIEKLRETNVDAFLALNAVVMRILALRIRHLNVTVSELER